MQLTITIEREHRKQLIKRLPLRQWSNWAPFNNNEQRWLRTYMDNLELPKLKCELSHPPSGNLCTFSINGRNIEFDEPLEFDKTAQALAAIEYIFNDENIDIDFW